MASSTASLPAAPGRVPAARTVPASSTTADPMVASEFSYAGRTRSSDGRRCAASRPTVQAFRTNWRISTPLATGSHGTGIPAAVHDPVSGISPAAPIACQLTELGLTRITARGAGARPCAKVANNPSEPRESPIAATRVGSTSV